MDIGIYSFGNLLGAYAIMVGIHFMSFTPLIYIYKTGDERRNGSRYTHDVIFFLNRKY